MELTKFLGWLSTAAACISLMMSDAGKRTGAGDDLLIFCMLLELEEGNSSSSPREEVK